MGYRIGNGDKKLVTIKFPDRKNTALCLDTGNTIQVLGYFQYEESEEIFIESIREIFKDILEYKTVKT